MTHSQLTEFDDRSAIGAPASLSPPRILRLDEVLRLTGLGKTSIYELQSTGDFPMRVHLIGRRVGWIEREVTEWLANRQRHGEAPAAIV